MKRSIKLAFCDFWPGFDPRDNYFTNLLRTRYDIRLTDDPEFLIYACVGKEHLRYSCIRIFVTFENRRPDFRVWDYALTSDHLGFPEHYRLPVYAQTHDAKELVKSETDMAAVLAAKSKFCNFLYSNPSGKQRVRFFHKLKRYKRIDSGGRIMNNIGGLVKDKLKFLKQYKFTIAFENSSYPGYTTEKITDPMRVGSLPIYWGNELVHLDFNPKSFINYYDYRSEEALIERIIEIDQNDDLYLEYLRQPYYHGNHVNQFVDPENVLDQFDRIFQTKKTPVAQIRRYAILNWFQHRDARDALTILRRGSQLVKRRG